MLSSEGDIYFTSFITFALMYTQAGLLTTLQSVGAIYFLLYVSGIVYELLDHAIYFLLCVSRFAYDF